MIGYYYGVEIYCAFPNENPNSKIKEALQLMENKLKMYCSASLYQYKCYSNWKDDIGNDLNEMFSRMGVSAGEYCLRFSTKSFRLNWTDDLISEVVSEVSKLFGKEVAVMWLKPPANYDEEQWAERWDESH